MSLSIRIISSPAGETISQWNNFFPEEGGVIGRGFGATLQLNDELRNISASHAIIGKTARGYHVMDNSTNGLFINGTGKPLGKGNSTALNDGDILDIGGYRLLVSCFLPTQAKSQLHADEQTHRLFSDDPFHIETSNNAEPQAENAPEPMTTNSDADVIDSDPFTNSYPEKPFIAHEVALNFNALDDSLLEESEIEAHFEINKPTAEKRFNPLLVSEAREYNQEQLRIDKALEMALERLLTDISPQVIEGMFDDLAGFRTWWKKPNHWEMYKRYFSHQMANHDWHVKFQAYFHSALKLQYERNGGKL